MDHENLQVIKCDFNNPDHCDNVLSLINAYMMDKMGNDAPMPENVKENLIQGFSSHPSIIVLLVKMNDRYIGLATTFMGYSTFQAKKLLNIHDIIILPEFRGKGIGRFLMKEVEKMATRMDCCKITLEVRNDNYVAQELYRTEGYGEASPPMLFWQKPLE